MGRTTYEPLSQGEDTNPIYHDAPDPEDGSLTTTTEHIAVLRPPVYYNDGPFSPPSSVDETQEHLLQKGHDQVSVAERGHPNIQQDQDLHTRFRTAPGAASMVIHSPSSVQRYSQCGS